MSATAGDFTLTLPSPFGLQLDAMGMELVLEPFDGASGTATLVVENGDALMNPDGQLVTSFDLPRNTGRAHLYRLVAGNLVSGAAWYILEGP